MPAASVAAATEQLLDRLFPEEDEEEEEIPAPPRISVQVPRLNATDVPGLCISVTSALTGLRVYCASDHHEAAAALGLAPAFESGGHNGAGRRASGGAMLPKSVTAMMRQLDDEKIAEVGAQRGWRKA